MEFVLCAFSFFYFSFAISTLSPRLFYCDDDKKGGIKGLTLNSFYRWLTNNCKWIEFVLLLLPTALLLQLDGFHRPRTGIPHHCAFDIHEKELCHRYICELAVISWSSLTSVNWSCSTAELNTPLLRAISSQQDTFDSMICVVSWMRAKKAKKYTLFSPKVSNFFEQHKEGF